MRTITVKKNLYSFAELNYDAQTRVGENMEKLFFHDEFCESIGFTFKELFKSSEPQCEFDYSCSQGSGLNIYGDFSMNDLLNVAGLEPLQDDCTIYLKPHYNRCTYSLWIQYYYMEDLIATLECDCGIDKYDQCFKIAESICKAMNTLCTDLYLHGEEIISSYANPDCHIGELFESDGTFYCMENDL